MPALNDPLRRARRFVQEGRFQEASDDLQGLGRAERESPEWRLLFAIAAWRLGDFTGSRTEAKHACDAFHSRGDADGEMRAANVAAAGAFALGDLEEAEMGFGQALAIAKRLPDEVMIARCSNNLGNVWFYLGRHERAQAYYRLARAGFDRVGFDHGIAETWLNTGFVLRDLGQMDDAYAAADTALDIAERAGSTRVTAQAFSSRGEATAALGDVALGESQVQRGLALAQQEEDRLAEAEALRVLGNIARTRERLDDAERLGRQALAIVSDAHHPWAAAEVQRDLAVTYLAQHRHAEAAAAYRAAEGAFLRLGSMARADKMAQLANDVASSNPPN